MTRFIHDHFLLRTKTAERLYHEIAEKLPIIDFHNHLIPKYMAEDRVFDTIGQLWLEGDHYKWRAMRSNGINEKFITGASSDWEKFKSWADTVPQTIRNPLYHWTHLELARYFDEYTILGPETAKGIYERCNEKVKSKAYSTRNLLRKMNVELLCTTEDPTDDLDHYKSMKNDFKDIKVTTSFRPDNVLNIKNTETFNEYMSKLEEASSTSISSYQDLCEAIKKRHDFFHDFGCCLSDIALDTFTYEDAQKSEIAQIFERARVNREIDKRSSDKFITAMLRFLCELNHNRNWVQQFHMGALRRVSERGVKQVGDACGFDSINDQPYIESLGNFLSQIEASGTLGKSIFYNLNPKDNAALATLVGNFNDGNEVGKMQYGPAWWFLDQKDGIEKQLNDVSTYGVLGNFVGMLTDSRSFLSFTRHEYFRRLLCDLIGWDVERGLIPDEDTILKPVIEGVCYHNAKNYFNF